MVFKNARRYKKLRRLWNFSIIREYMCYNGFSFFKYGELKEIFDDVVQEALPRKHVLDII